MKDMENKKAAGIVKNHKGVFTQKFNVIVQLDSDREVVEKISCNNLLNQEKIITVFRPISSSSLLLCQPMKILERLIASRI